MIELVLEYKYGSVLHRMLYMPDVGYQSNVWHSCHVTFEITVDIL